MKKVTIDYDKFKLMLEDGAVWNGYSCCSVGKILNFIEESEIENEARKITEPEKEVKLLVDYNKFCNLLKDECLLIPKKIFDALNRCILHEDPK